MRPVLVLVFAWLFAGAGPTHAKIIDTFETGPFSFSRATPGTTTVISNPNAAHCISDERSATATYFPGGTGTMSIALVPLQMVDDAVVTTFPPVDGGRLTLRYTGGPWDLTDGGDADQISVRLTGGGFPTLLRLTLSGAGGGGAVDVNVTGPGTYHVGFAEFGPPDPTAITFIAVAVESEGWTVGIEDVSTTRAQTRFVYYSVWDSILTWLCATPGTNSLRWNWQVGIPGGPEIIPGPALEITGVSGQNCQNVVFSGFDSGDGAGEFGDLSVVHVDWQSSTFDDAAFEMRLTTDPDAPYTSQLLGTPMIEAWETGFVVSQEIQMTNSEDIPDGVIRQDLIVAPHGDQALTFDSVEALPLGANGGYSLSFHVVGDNTFDPTNPLLEMVMTADFYDAASAVGVEVVEPAGASRTLRAVPTVSRTSSKLVLSRPSKHAGAIELFDVRGRLVRRLLTGVGTDSVVWDGRSGEGELVASGVYLARHVGSDGEVATTRVVRLR